MKTLNTIMKVLTALAAVAGAVYVVATYGDEIVAWAKRLMSSLPKCPCCCQDADIEEEPAAEEAEEAPAEEAAPADTAEPAEAAEEVPAPAPNEPVAEETDFAE